MTTRQVQRTKITVWEELKQLRAELRTRQYPFAQRNSSLDHRAYPGEPEGTYLAEQLNSLPPSKTAKLVESLRSIQAMTVKAQRGERVHHLQSPNEGMKTGFEYLYTTVMPSSTRHLLMEVHEDGLIVQPTTLVAKLSLAVLVLDKKGRIDRVRNCLHCGDWFYARFKHQQFCADPAKQCQWNHYHTSEWRKKNRKKNRLYQRAYREEPYGKPKATWNGSTTHQSALAESSSRGCDRLKKNGPFFAGLVAIPCKYNRLYHYRFVESRIWGENSRE
jgi:hypothetical protein